MFTVPVSSLSAVDGVVERSAAAESVTLGGDSVTLAGDLVVVAGGGGGYQYTGNPGGDIGTVEVSGGAETVSRGFARFSVPPFVPVSATLSIDIGLIQAEFGKTLFDLAVRVGSGILPADGVGDADPETVFGLTFPTSAGSIGSLQSSTTRTLSVPASAINRGGFTDIRIAASNESASYGGRVPISSVRLIMVMRTDIDASDYADASGGGGAATMEDGSGHAEMSHA